MSSLQAQALAIAEQYQPPAVGNHSMITDAPAVHEFLHELSEGNYIETAAKIAGISKQTVYNWLKRGQAGEEPYNLFVDAVEKAQAKAEAVDVANVRKAGKAGPQFWAASMTFLERRYPDRWGKRQEEAAGPRVVVQIGVQDSDVKVLIASPTFASPPSLSPEDVNS